jgi:hypothetical protein
VAEHDTPDRPMPPVDAFNGRIYYGLPDAYPFNREGFIEEQAARARWVKYEGWNDSAVRWEVAPGTKLELWPGGAIFNESGTLVGWFKLIDYGRLAG